MGKTALRGCVRALDRPTTDSPSLVSQNTRGAALPIDLPESQLKYTASVRDERPDAMMLQIGGKMDGPKVAEN
jgi:hypothetical protein